MMNTKNGNLSGWAQLSNSNVFIEFIDTTLRGCAQVMFQNNPLTGLFFFIAILVGAYGEGNPAVAFGCVLGTAVATLTGLTMSDRASWRSGLYGYNGCLVGAALPTFLVATPVVWACIILGSIVSVIVMACIANILKTWKVAALTAPFVLTTWMILLASYAFAGLHSSGLPTPALPHPFVLAAGTATGANIFVTLFNGISEVFLFSSLVGGILFVIGLAVESLWAAVFATSIASVAGPIISNNIKRIVKGRISHVERKNHFIIVGSLALNVYNGLRDRGDDVTVVCAVGSQHNFPPHTDLIEGDPSSVETVGCQGKIYHCLVQQRC